MAYNSSNPFIYQNLIPEIERIKYNLRRKHPDWSEARIQTCAVYAQTHPKPYPQNNSLSEEKRKQTESEISKPFTNQLTFDDLMKGSAAIGFTK